MAKIKSFQYEKHQKREENLIRKREREMEKYLTMQKTKTPF